MKPSTKEQGNRRDGQTGYPWREGTEKMCPAVAAGLLTAPSDQDWRQEYVK